MLSFLARWWGSFVLAPLRQADKEAEAKPQGSGKTLFVLIVVALVLVFQRYFLVNLPFLRSLQLLRDLGLRDFADWWAEQIGPPVDTNIRWLTYWACGCIVTYLVVPALIVLCIFRERLADYGFKFRGAFKDGWIYVVCFAVVGPLVLLVSRNAEFQRTYPFFQFENDGEGWRLFWRWECLYALQFLALEFFFRGFMVHGLRRRLGASAIAVMMVPYCMIHFEKPLPESLGAIVAGLVLGFMSVRTRSIILGAAIHISVALSMDFASLCHKGYVSPSVVSAKVSEQPAGAPWRYEKTENQE